MKDKPEQGPEKRTPAQSCPSCAKKYKRPVRWLRAGMATVSPFPLLFMIVVMLFGGGLASSVCNAAGNSPEVRVGSELDFPPYAFVDEGGGLAGFSIELIKAVAGAMGLSIEISTDTWDTMWNALVAGQLDVLPIVANLPERQRLVDFSLPHTETYDAFFVRQGDPPIKNIAAAQGMEIVVMRSDAAHHEMLERNFQGNLVLVDTIPEGLVLISSGKHKALLCSKLIGTMLIKKHGLRGISAGPPIPDYKRVFSFCVQKGDRELLEKLNQGLLIVKTNGQYERIYEKWLTYDDPWRKMRKYFLPAIIMVTAITLIAGVWLVTLQRLVKKRNHELAERKRAEEALRAALREKEVLLRELYHRTKNNMQVITGLLNLQADGIEDEKVLEMFKDIVRRIESMALVHQNLYQTKNLSTINLKDYIQDLSKMIMKNNNRPEAVTLQLDTESAPVKIDVAIPCGLVMNELISNALKYAFPGQRQGEIRVMLRRQADGQIEMGVEDNGVGLPEGLDIRECDSLGLKLVVQITEHQLRGQVEVQRERGTQFRIRFKEPEYKERV